MRILDEELAQYGFCLEIKGTHLHTRPIRKSNPYQQSISCRCCLHTLVLFCLQCADDKKRLVGVRHHPRVVHLPRARVRTTQTWNSGFAKQLWIFLFLVYCALSAFRVVCMAVMSVFKVLVEFRIQIRHVQVHASAFVSCSAFGARWNSVVCSEGRECDRRHGPHCRERQTTTNVQHSCQLPTNVHNNKTHS